MDDDGDGFTELMGDCDDTDPGVSPRALELFGDAIDGDCDGNADLPAWGFGGYAWEAPLQPRVVRTNQQFVLGATAQWTSLFDRNDPALALLFPVTSGGVQAEEDVVVWNNISPVNTFGMGPIDLVADADRFWVAATYFAPGTSGLPEDDRMRMLIREHVWQPGSSSYEYELANRVYEWRGFDTDIDLVRDADGTLYGLSCGGSARTAPLDPAVVPPPAFRNPTFQVFALESPVSTNPPQQDVRLLAQRPLATDRPICFVETDLGSTDRLTVCDRAGCESWNGDASVPDGSVTAAGAAPWDDLEVREADNHDGLLVFANTANGGRIVDGATTYDVFANTDIASLDAMWNNGVMYMAGVVAHSDVVRLAWGPDPANPTQTVDLRVFDADDRFTHEPFEVGCDPLIPGCTTGRNFEVERVSLHKADDRMMISVSARSIDVPLSPVDLQGQPRRQDAIGWAFLGFAP
ncbi:MAG: putative metal-binding motif-containing protein [Alphaproteobacteria bacterium]|nr:putative metal-binding motif-containing protein [Alphaproteobacteria bacterium]